jgi:uncharacterized membrane protein YebE (DUF533 family)
LAIAAEPCLVGGTDPGADALGVASLAAVGFDAGRGYKREQVDEWRRRALNTVAHLEAQVEALRVQVSDLRRRLEADVGAAGLIRGLAFLACELRHSTPDEGERAWVAQELTAVILAGSKEAAAERAAAFVEHSGAIGALAGTSSPASRLVQAILGQGGAQ